MTGQPNNNFLTLAELREFKAALLAKIQEILDNVVSMESEALKQQRSDLSTMPIHMADLGTDNFDREFTLGLMEGERKLLWEINDALDRIEDGTYGICEGSGKPISKARLEAIPWAKYCVEYANMLEKGLIRNHTESYLSDSDYDYSEDDED